MTEIEHLKKYRHHTNLNYFLDESHWNYVINGLLYKNLHCFHEGIELGIYLNPQRDTLINPIQDYSNLYAKLLDESYFICSKVVKERHPEIKFSEYLSYASTWKFRKVSEFAIVPNAIDMIEAYHIICMSFVILSFVKEKSESIKRFINQICISNNEVYYMMQSHNLNIYCQTYQVFIWGILQSKELLGVEYDYETMTKSMTKDFVWYDNIQKGYQEEMSNTSPLSNKEQYKEILSIVYNGYKGYEKLTNSNKNESELRDCILPVLQTRGYTATGETYNKKGKTDICIKDKDGNNIFVAECKFWNGSKALHDAINQLFDRYITWRDIQTALIVFVKNDSFTKILSEIKTAVKTHPYFEQECGISEDTSFSFKFHHSTDIERLINLEVMVFHFPQ